MVAIDRILLKVMVKWIQAVGFQEAVVVVA